MMVMVMVVLLIVLRVTVQVEDFLWRPGTMTARSLVGKDHVRREPVIDHSYLYKAMAVILNVDMYTETP